MKKLVLLIVLQLSLFAAFGQKKGLNYQAVILDPKTIEVPGIAVTGQPLSNGKVWVRFSLKSTAGIDYEETQQTTTDEFGLISLTVGTGIPTATSKAKIFDSVLWNSELKTLIVAVNFDGGTKYTEVSNQSLNYTPYALYAESVDYKNVRDSPKNLSQFNNDSGYLVPKDLDPLKSNIANNTKAIADNQVINEGKFLVVNQTIEALDKKVKADITNINNTLTDHDNRINTTANNLSNTANNLNSQIGQVRNLTEATANTVNNLGTTYESAGNKSAATDLGGGNPSDVLFPTQRAAKTYVDNAVNIAVASGAPDATTLASGKIQLTGDLGGTATNPTVPGLANKENVSNKSTNVNADAGSDTKYPSVRAIKTYVDQATMGIALQATVDAKADKNSPVFTGTPSLPSGTTAVTQSPANNSTAIATTAFVQGAIASATIVDADANTKGKIQLAGDLGGTAAAPTVPALANKEDVSNKSTSTALGTSNSLYPTQNAVKVYVDNQVASATIADADANTKGKIQLAGDLTGTAAAPAIAASAVTSAKIADGTIATADIADNAISTAKVADASITDAKIVGVAGSKVTGNITGNAANVTGTVAIANGGTGATTATAALTNLGAQASANLSTDISADAASLTKYPAVKSMKDYVDNSVAAATIADATTSLKGKIQLGGDLAGTNSTAASPVITDNAITTVKINADAVTSAKILDGTIGTTDLADASVTSAKISGPISIAKGGTGSATQNFVDLTTNQTIAGTKTFSSTITGDISGNAGTATTLATARNIYGNSFDGSAALTGVIASTYGGTGNGFTKITGPTTSEKTFTLPDASATILTSNTAVTIAQGGTGATTAGAALTALGAQSTANLSTDISADAASTTKYPAVKSIKDYVDASVVSATPDADATTKGKIQLAGDLTGTAASPEIAASAVTTAKINDGAVNSAKIADGTIVNADINASAAIADTKLATISTAGKVSNSATTATDANTASAIVARDANGNFTAGTITANVTGLASKASNINGGGLGDIPYQSAANTTSLLTGSTSSTKQFLTQTGNGSTSAAPAWARVQTTDISDLGGNVGTFLATPTSVNLANAITNETGTGSVVFNTSPTLVTPTIGAANATSVAFAGATSGTATLAAPAVAGTTTITLPSATGTLATLDGTETLTNKTFTSPTFTSPALGTPASGVLTNATGLPLTTGVTGTLPIANGGTGATTATGALTALGAQASANLSTDISADAASTSKYPAVKTIKDYVDASVTSGAPDATTSVKGKIQLAGDLGGTGTTAAAPVIANNAITTLKINDAAVTSAKISDGAIVNADINASAAIVDTKLATIATAGKVSNSATTATEANTASAIVARDASGDFAAGMITANLTGLASKATNINGGAVGAIPYQSAANTTALLTGNASATKKFLTQSGNGTVATAPVWAGIDVADISGTLPVANGGTGVTTVAANLVFAGPTSGASAAAPSFRSLVAADLPAGSTNYVINGTTQQASTNFNISGAGTIGTDLTVTGNASIGGTATITGATTLSALTASKGVFTDASKRLTSTGTLGTDQGGTGMTSFNSGGAMYATSTSALTTGTLPTSAGGTGLTSYTSGGALYTTSTTAITSGTLPISAGGTGSTTQNFVDLTTAQTIAGTKTFSSTIAGSISGNAATVTNGVYTTDKLSALSATTSSELASVISNETGSGALVFATSPTLVTPTLGVASATSVAFAGSTSGTATISAPAVAGTGTAITLPAASGTLATLAGTETLTNKTLTSPTLTAPALGTPASGVLTNATGLPLTTGVTGTLPIANGGTGATTKAAAFDALSPMTASGDIIYGGTSGTGTVLAKGTNGQVLTLASGVPSWATPAGVTSIGAISASSTANGASITSGVLNLAPADGTNGGVVTTAAQTFAGAKTFSADLTVNGLTVGRGNTGDNSNTALGVSALLTNTAGTDNTAVGNKALKLTNGNGTTGSFNAAFGSVSMENNTTGARNAAFGTQAIRMNTTGNYNSGFGYSALYGVTTASDNTAMGYLAGYNTTTGAKNIFIGSNAGSRISTGTTANSSGLNSVLIGYDVRPLADGDNNEIVLSGYNGTAGTVGLGSNTTLIGNSATTDTRIMGALTLPNTTASTSSTTGALIVSGGVGIAKELNVGATTASTSTTTGALIVAGGAGIAGRLNVGGNTVFTGTIEIDGGTPGAGKVLVSDANGLASWSANSHGGVSSITASSTMAATDNYNFIVFSGSTASQTITLPSASLAGAGREITIKNIASVSVAVNATAGTLISDSTTTAATSLNIGIEPSNNWIKAISNGTNWIILRALF